MPKSAAVAIAVLLARCDGRQRPGIEFVAEHLCRTKQTVRVVPLNGGSAAARAGRILSIFRKQSNVHRCWCGTRTC